MSESQRATRDVLLEATQRQRIASDPLVSSWVGASAGSGKTKVLTDRMLRLLLPREDGRPGTAPQKILALTFTKAAANEMALRLSKKLSQWAVMESGDLSQDIQVLLGRTPKSAEVEAARKLFARVVDAPGGLNIMTIHSFCQSVLGRFPIEAGLPPHFRPLEEDQARALLEEAQKNILSHAGTNDASPLQTAIQNISTRVTEDAFSGLLKAIIAERGQVESVLKRTFGIEGLYTKICTLLGIRPGLTADASFLDFCGGGDRTGLRKACAALAGGSKTDQGKAADIQAFWDETDDRTALYADYKSAFITSSGTVGKRLATQKACDLYPDLLNVLTAEAERILAFEDERRAIVCAETTRDLLLIGQAVLQRYQALKDERGAVDFDDLILRTLSLFKGDTNSLKGLKVTPWILYKLDEGLDHILVDEAQDTNPEQWEIIRALTDDFFSGEGAADDVRTLFVVGDKKQSIFSFQRAAPEKFDDMYRWFDKKIREAGGGFAPVDINTSFRSVRTILDAVDAVFAPDRNLMVGYPPHIAQREGQPGLVELWPLFETAQSTEEDETNDDAGAAGWSLPDRLVESESGSARMASKIGDTIKLWLDRKTRLETYDRPIRAGDIMVLVRARNAFVNQLVRALKTRKIPVSGVDRMVLGDQIAVQDLCAAARFALLPDDSLTLAVLLKSPFIGMDEDALYALSQGRPTTLWESIKKNGDSLIISWLEKLISQAGSLHPYEFFSSLVQEPCPADEGSGMRAIRRRLGEDALDPLDEFLNLTLAYQGSHGGGLQSFLHWHEQGSSEIKRQMEEAGGAVRIMTVHGAKGLQAPIVFLPDTVRVKSPDPDRILWPNRTGLDVPLYLPSRDSTPQAAAQARSAVERQMDEEYRRLLYVAMTRAEERLYIGGYVNKRGPSQGGRTAYWYDDIRGALEAHPDILREESGIADRDGNDQPLLRFSAAASAPPDKSRRDETRQDTQRAALPEWAFKPAPAEPFPPRPLAPSRPSGPEPAAASPLAESQAYRFQRGNAAHRLLQTLPDMPPAARRTAAEKFLARPALGLPPDMQKSIAGEVMAILEDKTFGAIFGPGSMAEIPVTGFLHGKTLVSAQIDRVLITDEEILIVDFKTNRPPPENAADVPPAYLRQMKIYADLMQEIYPGRTVRTALLWTDGARLMEIGNS